MTVEAGEAVLAYRFARVFPQTAVVEVSLAGRAVDRFESRGGVFQERRAVLGALPATPLTVRIDADSHERKDRGLKMDWLRVETPRGAIVRLRGTARWTPALVVALVALLLMLGGWPARQAAALAAPRRGRPGRRASGSIRGWCTACCAASPWRSCSSAGPGSSWPGGALAARPRAGRTAFAS